MTAHTLVERGDPIARRIVLAPEVDAKSLAVARSLQLAVDRAVGYGIPFAELQGMDAFLDETLAENRELAAIEIVAADSAVRYACQAGTGAMATRAVRMPVAEAADEIVLYVKAEPTFVGFLLLLRSDTSWIILPNHIKNQGGWRRGRDSNPR